MPSAPRTVKDVPAQEFVIALAQYFRSTGKVVPPSSPPAMPERRKRRTLRRRARHDAVAALDLTRDRPTTRGDAATSDTRAMNTYGRAPNVAAVIALVAAVVYAFRDVPPRFLDRATRA